MTVFINAVYALATVAAAIGGFEQTRLERRIELSREVEPGATKAEVESLLGKPIGDWAEGGGFLSPGQPTWAYGTVIDLPGIVCYGDPVPCALSFKLRIFGPYESDLVFRWDAEGRVESITRPGEPSSEHGDR